MSDISQSTVNRVNSNLHTLRCNIDILGESQSKETLLLLNANYHDLETIFGRRKNSIEGETKYLLGMMKLIDEANSICNELIAGSSK